MAEKISNRNGKYQFAGKLSDFQKLTASKNSYMKYEQDRYSPYQNQRYKRVLHGLKSLSKEDYDTACKAKKQRISKVYLRGQRVINKLKQESTNRFTNFIFKVLFPEAPLTQWLLDNNQTDDSFKNTLHFADIGITKHDIIDAFIKEGLLPQNFIEQKTNPNKLPRLKKKSK